MVSGQGKLTGIKGNVALDSSILPKQCEETAHDFFAAGEFAMRAFSNECSLQFVDISYHREDEETGGAIRVLRSPHLSGNQVNFVHTMGIRLFRTKHFYTPGAATAWQDYVFGPIIMFICFGMLQKTMTLMVGIN